MKITKAELIELNACDAGLADFDPAAAAHSSGYSGEGEEVNELLKELFA